MNGKRNNFKGGGAIRQNEGNCVHGHRICGLCNHNWDWFLKKGCEGIYDNQTKAEGGLIEKVVMIFKNITRW